MDILDGNLYALARYQAEVDADAVLQEAIEEYLEENPEATEKEAIDYLEARKQDYWDYLDDKAADMAWEREYGY